MMAVLVAALVGAAAGLHTATWGMYKDSLYEGFTWRKYARSVVVGSAAAILLQSVLRFDLTGAAGLVLLFGSAYVVERAVLEFHKTFVRREDQSKYFIPMQFAVFGRVVHNPLARGAAGVACAAAVTLVVVGVVAFQHSRSTVGPAATALLLGSIGGWVSAFGGAWKDAPKEGFQFFKFFRSPVISALYGLVLGTLTTNYVVIAFGALGFTVATIETYKTFVKSQVPRGKFAGKPVRYPEMEKRRRPFAGVFTTLWIAILVTLGLALMAAPSGLMASSAVVRSP